MTVEWNGAFDQQALKSPRRRGIMFYLAREWDIVHALMMRDIRSRFFGSSWGFIIAVLWPLSHIFLLTIINSIAGRIPPYGNSAALWYATGLLPFMAFMYTSRFVSLGLLLNKFLLSFPTIKIIDVILSRCIIEIVNMTSVTLCTIIILLIIGVSPVPFDVTQAFYAMIANIALGVGFGLINAVITLAIPAWITGFALFTILMWLLSGVLLSPDGLPTTARYILSFNPSLQGVEWMRSAFYPGLGSGVLDRSYMLEFALMCLFVGLVLERMIRKTLLQG